MDRPIKAFEWMISIPSRAQKHRDSISWIKYEKLTLSHTLLLHPHNHRTYLSNEQETWGSQRHWSTIIRPLSSHLTPWPVSHLKILYYCSFKCEPSDRSLLTSFPIPRFANGWCSHRGAFATTWKAFDRNTGEFRAIKVIQKHVGWTRCVHCSALTYAHGVTIFFWIRLYQDHRHNKRKLEFSLMFSGSNSQCFWFGSIENLINFQREVAILEKVNHVSFVSSHHTCACWNVPPSLFLLCLSIGIDQPNIVKFYESREDDEYIWIVLELVDGGEYLDYVCNADGLDEESCRVITAMLLQALAYLAALKIAHRDLKPENILMTSGANPRPKIADFGLAKQLNKPNVSLASLSFYLFSPFLRLLYWRNDIRFLSYCWCAQERFKTQCGECTHRQLCLLLAGLRSERYCLHLSGTPAYLAPEVVVPSLNIKKPKGYTVAVDMYSLGVIVYAALGNCSPFDGQDQKGDIRQVCRDRMVDTRVLSQLKPNISEAALEFITLLTSKNVEDRLTASKSTCAGDSMRSDLTNTDCLQTTVRPSSATPMDHGCRHAVASSAIPTTSQWWTRLIPTRGRKADWRTFVQMPISEPNAAA